MVRFARYEVRALLRGINVGGRDEPDIEWRGDCYTQRPAAFVPGVGGCGYLRGYLSVWYGRQFFAAEHPLVLLRGHRPVPC